MENDASNDKSLSLKIFCYEIINKNMLQQLD